MSIHDTTNRQSLARRIEVSEDSMPRGENDGRRLLITMTKEIYMLARLHYDLLNPEKISRVFLKLRCMEHDPVQDRWVWLYEAEAKRLKFKGTYKRIFLLKEDRSFLGFFSSETRGK